jgi:putative oxidoreductase
MTSPLAARAARLGLAFAGRLDFLPGLLTRLVIGYAFFQTGGGKLANFENTVAFFTDLGIPMPELNAAFVARLEYWGGVALIVGLLTRLAAAGLLSTMVVALMTADKATFLTALLGSGDVGLTDVTPVVYALFLLWLALKGPGLLSLDTLLAKALGLRDEGPQPQAPAAT